MKKIILAIIVVSVSTVAINAQAVAEGMKKKKEFKRITYNVGVDVGIPVGYLAEYSSLAYGGSVQAEYSIIKKMGIIASVNYFEFIGKGGGRSLPFIPVLGGFKYYFKPKIFISGQAGVSFYGGRDKGDGIGGSGEKYFTYAGGVGFNTSKRFDLLLKYETAYIGSAERSYSFLGARVGYNFSLK